MLKPQFFLPQLAHCRASPSAFATQNPLVLVQEQLQQSIQPAGPGSTALSLHIHLQTMLWPGRSIHGRHHIHHARGMDIKCSTRPRMETADCLWLLFMKLQQKFLWNILKKKGEELGGVVGILDCFILVCMVYQLPITDWEVKDWTDLLFQDSGGLCLLRVCQNLVYP